MRNNLKRFRLASGLTQDELGMLVGTTKGSISRWEIGKSDPTPAQQQDLAIALNVRVTRLFPDFVPQSSSRGTGLALPICTREGLMKSANVKLGEKMMVKVQNVSSDGSTFVPGTVVQVTPMWFRVRLDKSGCSTCVLYQSFLKENDVRRI